MSDAPPESSLGPLNQNWRRWIESIIARLGKRLEEKYNNDIVNSFKATGSSLRLLSGQVSDLQTAQITLSAQQAYLSGLPISAYSSGTTSQSIAAGNWMSSGQPSVTITTPTGKLKVTVSAFVSSSAGATSMATFSIPGYISRTNQISALFPSFTGTGNAFAVSATSNSSTGGSYVQLVTNLPTDTPVTVTFEFAATAAAGLIISPAILAEVAA